MSMNDLRKALADVEAEAKEQLQKSETESEDGAAPAVQAEATPPAEAAPPVEPESSATPDVAAEAAPPVETSPPADPAPEAPAEPETISKARTDSEAAVMILSKSQKPEDMDPDAAYAIKVDPFLEGIAAGLRRQHEDQMTLAKSYGDGQSEALSVLIKSQNEHSKAILAELKTLNEGINALRKSPAMAGPKSMIKSVQAVDRFPESIQEKLGRMDRMQVSNMLMKGVEAGELAITDVTTFETTGGRLTGNAEMYLNKSLSAVA